MMKSASLATAAQPAVGMRVQVMQPESRAPLSGQERGQLLDMLPAATRVLQVGADTELGAGYLLRHRMAQWHRVDSGAQHQAPDAAFDLVIISDGLQTVHDPARLLRHLAGCAAPDAALFISSPNAAQWSALQRLIETDLTRAGEGLWGRDALHQFSPSSLFKLLLDAGWMPHLAGAVHAGSSPAATHDAAMAIADAAGVPRATAKRMLDMQHLIIEARRGFDSLPREAGAARFSVVVPTTRDNQLRLNVAASPGLAEVQARIVTCSAAVDPAQALNQGLLHCDSDWVLFCHQDVYFPSGFGEQLNALLASVPADQRDQTLIGFAGMAVNASANGFAPAGFVIDRLHRFDHPASERVLSIDELAIVVSRRSIHRIDPAIGWHLWATELCLASICNHQVFPRIVRLPLFHNSLNDHQLPQAFHRSAQYLAAKYPSFGPIHTLCGVIDPARASAAASAPVMESAHDADAPVDLAVRLDSVGRAIDTAMQAGDFNRALEHLVAGVHQHYRLPGVAHHALYYPGLDRRLEQLAQRLEGLGPVPKKPGRPHGQLLIATELYALGGHTRALEDMSHQLDKPTLLLTDLFKTYQQDPQQLDWVGERFKHVDLVVLPAGTYWEKCAMLRRFTAALNPECIVHFAHHQDPIPFVATLRGAAPNQVFVHHADHNPSLGCTLSALRHVDLSEGVRELCARHLPNAPALLPLYVEDLGVKAFNAVRGADCSVATSGHPAKFARTGPVALAQMVRATLTAVRGCHYHIGPLDADWVAEIRASLQAVGIDGQRFVHVGLVPSVWQSLKALDAAFYVASAPLGGGRVAIEAQGCGYPVLYFENRAHTSLPANHPLYASHELKWTGPDELSAVLAAATAHHQVLSQRARAHYEARFSRAPYRAALQQILRA
jgi:hypothetical protein